MTDLSASIQSAISSRIHDELAAHDEELVPCFYAVTGSHQYGTDTASSDIDVKGFHCADGSRYMVFDSPESQVSFETSIQPANSSVEITSYELKKFGEMLLKSDFSIIELIGGGMDVYTRDQTLLCGVKDTLAEMWPVELPHRYLGMADSIYARSVEETSPEDPSDLKPYVYSLRGCLAAEYVLEYGDVEPRLNCLAETILDKERAEHVEKFITAVRADQLPSQAIQTEVRQVIKEKLNTIEASGFDTDQRSEYKTGLADWMLAVREETGTR